MQILEVDDNTYRILAALAAQLGITISELVHQLAATASDDDQMARYKLRRIIQD